MRYESTGPRPQPTRRTGRGLAWLVLLAGVVPGFAAAAEVVVRVDGVSPGGGSVLVSLCEGGLDAEHCAMAQTVQSNAPVVMARFGDVAPGIYAVAAFQDRDGSGTLDRSPRGLPREPYGFSRDAGRTAPPRFDRAAFVLEGAGATVTVHLSMPGKP